MRIVLRSWWRPRWELLLVAAAAIVALARLTPAHSPAAPAAAAAPVGFRLSGTVHASTDVLPAWVLVWNPERRLIAEADANGWWSMTLPAGEYRIGASRLPEEPPEDVVADIAVNADLDGIALLLDREGLPSPSDVITSMPRGSTWIEGRVAGVRDGAITIEMTMPGREGTRRIVRVHDGTYRVAVTGKPLWLMAHRWPVSDQTLEHRIEGEGPMRADVDLTEAPVGTVFGRVIDEDGRPLAGVKVMASHIRHFPELPAVALTDKDGSYAVPVRRGGWLTVQADVHHGFAAPASGPGPWPMDLHVDRKTGYFACGGPEYLVQHRPPGKQELARLRALAASHATAAVAPTAAPAAGFRIAGTVHADADVAAAWVIASNAERRSVARVGDDGRWSMTLPAGDYRIGASRLLEDPAEDLVADLAVDGDLDDIRLILDRGPMWPRSYVGRLAVQTSASPGEEVWIEGAAGIRDGLITIEVGTNAPVLLARRIVRVRNGVYRLRVAGKPWELTAHRWPMYEHRIDDEIPAPRAGTVRLDLELTDTPVVTVFGRVMDVAGLPAAGVEVEAYHPGDLTGRTGTTWTDREGGYVVPVRAGGRIVVHHHDRFEFTARGVGPGPWPMPLDLVRAERVITDCFHEPRGDRYYLPYDDELERLQALAIGRAHAR